MIHKAHRYLHRTALAQVTQQSPDLDGLSCCRLIIRELNALHYQINITLTHAEVLFTDHPYRAALCAIDLSITVIIDAVTDLLSLWAALVSITAISNAISISISLSRVGGGAVVYTVRDGVEIIIPLRLTAATSPRLDFLRIVRAEILTVRYGVPITVGLRGTTATNARLRFARIIATEVLTVGAAI